LLNVGGQEGDYPVDSVVDWSQAFRAAHYFLDTGQMDPDQRWRE